MQATLLRLTMLAALTVGTALPLAAQTTTEAPAADAAPNPAADAAKAPAADAAANPAAGAAAAPADGAAPVNPMVEADPSTEGVSQAQADKREETGEDDGDEAPAAAPAAAPAEATLDGKGKFDYGPSGILARDNRVVLAPLTLASGQPVATGEYTLTSGGYYRMDIVADGSGELALSGGDFFRAIWVNEVVVNDIEIRPMGVHSLEFDAAGTATISFVAMTPGRYTLSIPGSSGDSQQAVFTIR